MTTSSGAAAPAADDFASAFAEFSKPEDAAPAADTTAASAAPAAGETTPAAAGGSNDTGGTDQSAAAGGSGDTGGAGAGGAGEAVAPANTEDKGAAAPAAAGSDTGTGGEAAPAAAAPAAASPAPAATADADAILNKLGQLVEAASKPAEAKPAVEETKAPESPYTPEQAAELAQYDKDWPDVSKMEGIRRQGEYKQLLEFVFTEVRKYVDPVLQTVDSLAGRTHLTDVKGAIPDYSDNLRQQVVDWTKTQPAYLQPAFEHVINSGTVDEVKDLVNRYRQATGQAAPAPGGASAAPSGQGKGGTNELSGAAKEAAAALAPVESKRSEVVGSGDPSSFDDGWAQFAKDLG